MWCRHCQQDVPAVARLGDALRVCPRCASPLRRAPLSAPPVAFDAGIELDASRRTNAPPPIASPLAAFESLNELQRIARRLRRAPRFDPEPQTEGPEHEADWLDDPHDASPSEERSAAFRISQRRFEPDVAARPYGLLLLMACGATVLGAGVAMLLSSAARDTSPLALRGLTLAFAGQGIVALGVAGIVMRCLRRAEELSQAPNAAAHASQPRALPGGRTIEADAVQPPHYPRAKPGAERRAA